MLTHEEKPEYLWVLFQKGASQSSENLILIPNPNSEFRKTEFLVSEWEFRLGSAFKSGVLSWLWFWIGGYELALVSDQWLRVGSGFGSRI